MPRYYIFLLVSIILTILSSAVAIFQYEGEVSIINKYTHQSHRTVTSGQAQFKMFRWGSKKEKRKDDDNYRLPVARTKLNPKPKSGSVTWHSSRTKRIANWTLIATLCFLIVKFMSSVTLSSSSSGSLASILANSYKTITLSDEAYYDYDFESIDPDVISKFDDGVNYYKITQFGEQSITAEDSKKFEQEVSMLMDSTVEKYNLESFKGTPNGAENQEHVLLCVPLKDAENVLPLMFKNLMNITYPHELIDLAFLVSDCSEGDHTLDALVAYSRLLQNGTLSQAFADMEQEEKSKKQGTESLYLQYMDPEYLQMVKDSFSPPFHENYDKSFRSVQIFQKDFGQTLGQGFSDRHAVKVQGLRRKLMARARNWLTANALKPYHSWVYWRDADVELCPGSVIQDLMSKGYDVMVPNVWRPLPTFLGGQQPYDLNSWIESREALDLAKNLDEDDVIVEGYAEYPTWRFHLAYSRDANGDPNQVIDLDGVGGVSILARAGLFRLGVQFPAFTFENHAETEGFGKMAKKMGFKVGGLPNYTLWHIYEPSDDDLKEIGNKEREKRRGKNGKE